MFIEDRLGLVPQVSTFIGAALATIRGVESYEDGPVAIGDPSLGLNYQKWKIYLDEEEEGIRITNDDGLVIPIKDFGLDYEFVTDVSLAFDCVGNLFYLYNFKEVAYLSFNNIVGDKVELQFPEVITPKITLDVKDANQLGRSSIILSYLKDKKLHFRKSDDNFSEEFLLSNVLYERIDKVYMNSSNHLQWRMIKIDGDNL